MKQKNKKNSKNFEAASRMHRFIQAQEEHYQRKQRSAIGRFFSGIGLFSSYLAFALNNAFHLLFSASPTSFESLHPRNKKGTWTSSYSDHIKYKRRVRYATAGTPLAIIAGVLVSFGIAQTIFPAEYTLAAPTFNVTNSNDTGDGSLRKAIIEANNAADGTSPEIIITVANTPTILLGSALPVITHPNVTVKAQDNSDDIGIILNGSNLADQTNCFVLGVDADNANISGIAFRNCPAAGIQVQADNVVLGFSGAKRGRVMAYDSTRGIQVTNTADSTAIQNAAVGIRLSGGNGPLTEEGVDISGTNTTISGLVVGNADTGLYIAGDNTTVNSGRFGIKLDDSSIPNTNAGIKVDGAAGTKISGSSSSIIVSGNTGEGILVYGAESTTIENVAVGTIPSVGVAGNGMNGIVVDGSSNTTIGGDGTADPAKTVIASGNGENGIKVFNGSSSTTISGVIVGMDDTKTIKTAGNQLGGIYVEGVSGITIGSSSYDTVVAYNTNNGIDISNPTGGAVTVTNVETHDNGGHGIKLLDYAKATSATISGSTIGANTANGIYLQAGGEVAVSGNSFTGQVVDGIVLNAVSSCTITSNVIQFYTSDGLLLENSTSDCDITKNEIGYNNTDKTTNGGVNGVSTSESTSIRIGGDGAEDANTFGGNSNAHISIADNSLNVNVKANNFIDGFSSLITKIDSSSNRDYGQPVIEAANNLEIGGTAGIPLGTTHLYNKGTWFGSVANSVDNDGVWAIKASDLGLQSFGFADSDLIAVIQNDSAGNSGQASDSTTLADETGEEVDDGVDDGNGDGDENNDDSNGPATTVSTKATNLGSFKAEIEVTTDVQTKVTVTYGKDKNNLADSVTVKRFDTTHVVELVNLSAATKYYYRTTVTDENGNSVSEAVQSFKTLDAITDLVDPTVSVEGQTIYDADKNINVAPKQPVGITIEELSANRDIRFEIKNAKDNVVINGNWKEVNNGTAKKKFQGLKRYIQYTAHAEVRSSQKKAVKSSLTKVATFTKTRKKPTFTALNGKYTVAGTAQNLRLGGELNGLAGRVSLQNVATGAVAVSCKIQAGEDFCTMPFDPAPATYRVLFESVKNDIVSAPDQHLLHLSKPVMRTFFTTDPNDPSYNERMTTRDEVRLVGLGPEGTLGTVYLNGTKQGQVTWKTNIGWFYDMTFGSTCPAGRDCEIDVVFTKKKSGKEVSRVNDYLVKHANRVVDLQVTDIGGKYPQYNESAIVVTGGAGNIYRVTVDDELVVTSTLEQIDSGVQGQDTFLLPTDKLGKRTLRIQAEDPQTHLKGSERTFTYSVVAQVSAPGFVDQDPEVPDTDTDLETETGSGAEAEVDTSAGGNESGAGSSADLSGDGAQVGGGGAQVGGGGEAEVQTGGDAPVSQLTDEVSIENGVGIIEGEDTSGIQEIYLTPETDPVEQKKIKDRLNSALGEFDLTPSSQRIEADGSVTSLPAELNDEGLPIIRTVREIGPGASKQPEQVGVIELAGSAEPHALVYVTLRSDPVVKVTRADENGQWRINVPVDALPEGEHTAFLQTESRGVYSDEIEIAKFVVVEERRLSGSSWIIIINGVILGIILVVVATVQIQKRIFERSHPELKKAPPSSHLELRKPTEPKAAAEEPPPPKEPPKSPLGM